MAENRPTYYDILGVAPDAKITDINRAFARESAELRKETAAPDPRRAQLLREAHETLSDPDRRDAYDKSLRAKKATGSRRWAIAVAAVAAVGGASAYYLLQPPPKPVGPARGIDQIIADSARAMARVEAIDMSGNATPVATAFAIEDAMMVTSCAAIPVGAQLVVKLPPRTLPARISATDPELGICRLTVEGAGAWPLKIAGNTPGIGEKVYALKINSIGQVAVAEAKVTNLLPVPKGKIVEAAITLAPEAIGSPILDSDGRVVGVATVANDAKHTQHAPVPVAWIDEAKAPPEPVKSDAVAPGTQKTITFEEMQKQKVEDLNKGLRSHPERGPTVPNDL